MIGSISKSFAAIVVLQEVEAGRLDLHVSVNELLPWLELPEPFGPITLHHLLTHTSGLAAGTEDAPTGLGAATLLRSVPPTFAPGEHFWYSNDAYKLVGLVLERVTGTPAHELIRQRVLEPLGMTSSVAAITEDLRTDLATGYEPVFTDRPAQLRHPLVPAIFTVSSTVDGSIVSNVIDMAAHARLLLNRGTGTDGHGRCRRRCSTSSRRRSSSSRRTGRRPYGYGLDIGEDERGTVDRPQRRHGRLHGVPRGGAGERAGRRDPAERVGSTRGSRELRARRGSRVHHRRAAPGVWAPPEPTSIPEAAAFVGDYVDPEGGAMLRVAADDDGLRIALGDASGRLERDPLDRRGGRPVPGGASGARAVPAPVRPRTGRSRRTRRSTATGGSAASGTTGIQPRRRHRQEWLAYPGLYRNDDPWMPTLRVVLRKGRLALQFPVELSDEAGEAELQPLDDGWFAAGEPWEPRRIRFDRLVDGKAVVAEFNGGRWYRSFED